MKKWYFYSSALILLAVLLVATTSNAAIYYVSTTGSDSNTGSQASPWRNPAYGASRLNPGDRLIILGGRYVITDYDYIISPNSGSASAYVTIEGEAGNRPILAGGQNLGALFFLSGAQYVKLRNLELTRNDQAPGNNGWCQNGIDVLDGPADHIILEALNIHHLGDMGLNAMDINQLQILNCNISYCGISGIGGPSGSQGGWRNITIRGTHLSHMGHYYHGIENGDPPPYERPDGMEIPHGSQGPMLVEDVKVTHNKGDGIDCSVENTTIRRCYVANNRCDGIKLWRGDSRIENTLIYGRGDGDATTTPWAAIVIDTDTAGDEFTLMNVTVDDTLGHNYVMYAMYDHPTLAVSLTIRNCIFRAVGPNSPVFTTGATNLTADHNLFFIPNSSYVINHGATEYTATQIASLGPGNRYGDPKFIKPAWGTLGDYHLKTGSPAINNGSTLDAPTIDLENHPRDSWPDIGAYESVFSPTNKVSLSAILSTLLLE